MMPVAGKETATKNRKNVTAKVSKRLRLVAKSRRRYFS